MKKKEDRKEGGREEIREKWRKEKKRIRQNGKEYVKHPVSSN